MKEVCQWCRHTGSCFNSTEHPVGLTPTTAAPAPVICNARCIVKTEPMCPPLDLKCGSKTDCAHCTNNSFCSFCDSNESCFNPCGDDHIKPEPVSSPEPMSDPTSEPLDDSPSNSTEFTPIDATEPMPIPKKLSNLMTAVEPPICPSCVWSVPGMCKVADACRKAKNCGDCTMNPGCGWCGSSDEGRCIPAINKEPCNGREGSKCKYWSYGSCEVACSAHSNCGTCLGGGCEWCAGGNFHNRRTSYCMVRTTVSKQSPNTVMTRSTRSAQAPQCIASFIEKCPNCSQNANCSSCLKHPYCGYCANANPAMSKCVEGEPLNGPFDPSDCTTTNSPDHNAGWILQCQAWNTTHSLPKPPVNPPEEPKPPVNPPIVHHPIPEPVLEPLAPPPITETPITTTQPIYEPTPIETPVAPPKTEIPPTTSQPSTAPKSIPPTPSTAPKASAPPTINGPAKALEPYMTMLSKRYKIGIIIGGSVAGGIVLFGGLLWVKIHSSSTHRYRTIGT